ncbi:hypothetical protein LTR84_008937 [Exophiala bonariae]|uniref:Uncharacterized protein n=1 Tax=Exophiala bonariae TaxID=1690606 RepID=A0AAV9MVW9_9EURO|nr:hypothetical protein LTR84_008937 [Exophiala bonariae]
MLSVKSLAVSLLLAAIVHAGDGGGGGGGGEHTRWLTTTCWETKSAEKEYITIWQTQTQTEWAKPESVTVWQTKWETPGSVTVYNTQTQLETKTSIVVSKETDIITTTATIYSTVNSYFTSTATQTQVQVSYQTATATIYSTVNNYFTDTATQTQTQTQTQVSRETATATATATVVSASISVITEFSTITDTVTEFPVCTTAPLVGLVTCPTRTLNPTYTPPTALPTDWLWGCPPDTLCTPKQIDCNFEPNLPADTYVCSPEDCKPVTPLPPLDTSWDSHNCTPYIPPPGYANLAPPIFDLGYDIFQFNGQPGPYCPPPPPPPPSTTWQDWTPPVSASSISSWADWSVSSPAGPAPSGWSDWTGHGDRPHGQSWRPSPPGITPRANLAERQDDAPDYSVPAACYNPCNAAVLNAQSCGLKGAVLCPVSGVFSQQYTNCGNCIDVNKDKAYTEPPRLISSLVKFLDYCSDYTAEAAAATQASSSTTVSTGGSSSLSTVASSTVVVAALSTSPTPTSSVPNGAETQRPSSHSLSFTIFMSIMALIYI